MVRKLKSSDYLHQSHLKYSFKMDIPSEKLVPNCISNKELLTQIYNELIQLNSK